MTTILPGKWPALEFLNRAEPIFVIPLAYFVLEEKIGVRSVIGVVGVVARVALIVLNGPGGTEKDRQGAEAQTARKATSDHVKRNRPHDLDPDGGPVLHGLVAEG